MKRTNASRNCSMKGIILLILVLTPPSIGQKYTLGSCPSLQSAVIAGFYTALNTAATQYYVYAISPSLFFHHWNCLSFEINLIAGTTQYTVALSGVNKFTGSPLSTIGTLTISGPLVDATDTTAADVFTFTFTDGWKTFSESFYLIAGTADIGYAVLYGCQNFGFGKKESALIFSTATALTPQVATAALNALTGKGFPLHAIRRTYDGTCTIA